MVLEVKNISFHYPLSDRMILENVDFRVESGEVVGLCAPSGYGKSTLGKILAGYEKPSGGSVTIDGRDPFYGGGYCPVQMMFQHPEKAINPKWKLRKLLAEAHEPTDEKLAMLGIRREWLDRWPAELSGGELQRFCVLRVLQPETRFLIADEMTTMLDAITQAQIWSVVTAYARENEMGLVVISHEKALVSRLCDRVVDMEKR